MTSTDLLGLLAATITTLSFVPQVWRTYKTRDVSAISLPMYAFLSFGIVLWIAYGLMRGDWPVIIANGITLVLALMITIMRLRFAAAKRAG